MTPIQAKLRMFGAWCGPGYLLLLFLGWGAFAGFLPPVAPSRSAGEIAHLFQDNTNGIRIGMVLVMWSAGVFIFFAAAIGQFLSKIEGSAGVLTYGVIIGGCGNMVLSFYPAIWWLVAAYRPERAAELTYIFNDMAWLQFIGGVSMFAAMPIAIGIAAFIDKSPDPVFPRWAGYFNFMVVMLIMPDQLLFFFHSGPWSWNGLFGLWIPVTLFGGWFLVTFFLMRAAVQRASRNPGPAAESLDPITTGG
jgi:MFS family permease